MAEESINEDIKWLEEQLEAKKREVAEKGEQKEEREMVREAISEATQAPQLPPSLPPPVISDVDADKTAYELKEKEHKEIVDELVGLVFSKNLSSAMKVANSLKNPHILDEFHDTLADHYYEKLIEARKLKT